MSLDLSIYLVTDSAQIASTGRTVRSVVEDAVAGGVTTVQVREKDASAAVFLQTVLDLAAVLPPRVSLLVNDRVDVFLAARAAGARVAGVHIGQSDLPVALVRTLIGPDAVLGLSASTPDEFAALGPADYVGIGALHTTTTKTDAPPALGYERFGTLLADCPVPAVAIGGVTARDFAELRRLGAAGGAVVSAICRAESPRDAAAELVAAWEAGA